MQNSLKHSRSGIPLFSFNLLRCQKQEKSCMECISRITNYIFCFLNDWTSRTTNADDDCTSFWDICSIDFQGKRVLQSKLFGKERSTKHGRKFRSAAQLCGSWSQRPEGLFCPIPHPAAPPGHGRQEQEQDGQSCQRRFPSESSSAQKSVRRVSTVIFSL